MAARASAPLSTARSSARPGDRVREPARVAHRELEHARGLLVRDAGEDAGDLLPREWSQLAGPSDGSDSPPLRRMIYSPFTGLCDASTAGRRPDRRATVELSPVEQRDTAIGASAVLLRRSAAARPDRRTPNRGETLHAPPPPRHRLIEQLPRRLRSIQKGAVQNSTRGAEIMIAMVV